MQDSWKRLESDSTSWQSTLTSSHNLQSQWPVVSTLCQEMKNHLIRKVGVEGAPKLGPYWKSQPATYKVNMEWKLELSLWTRTILTRGSEFLMAWTSWSQTRSIRSTTTTSRRPLKRRRKDLLLQADQRLKQNQEDLPLLGHLQELYLFVNSGRTKRTLVSSSTKNLPIEERIWTDVEPGAQSNQAYPVAKRLNTLLRNGQLPREEDGAIEFWRTEECLRNDLMQSISTLVWWNVEEQNGRRRRQQENISILYWLVSTRNSESPSSSRSFRTQSCWSFTSGQCVYSRQLLRVHLSHRMCNQFTLHHEFRIGTGRTKFEQRKKDNILHVCASNEQGT